MANGLGSLDMTTVLFIGSFSFILGILTWFFAPRIKKSLRFKAFLNVFGEVAAKQENIAISIPLWHVMRAPRGETRFIKETFDVAKDDEWYGPDKIVDFNDLEACLQISSLMIGFHPKPVMFTLDNESPLSTIGANKTIFIVGPPQANLLTKTVFNTKAEDGKPYLQPFFEYIERTNGDGHTIDTIIRDKQEIHDYESIKGLEYCMVLRVPNVTRDGYFFIVTGFHEAGTLAAATFLKENWREFADAEPTAAVLLRLEKPKSMSSKYMNIQVEKVYGFPTQLSLKQDEAIKQLINDWNSYLEQVSSQIDQEPRDYIYPIIDTDTAEREFVQDPQKMTTEQSEISKLLITDWRVALDFGCGVGDQFHLFDQESKETRFLIGIDTDCSRASLARTRAKEILKQTESTIICGGIEILERAPAELTVDRILCAQVLGHVAEEQLIRILQAFHRVLVPTGRCAILIPVIGETFSEHLYHAAGWNGTDDYTHIVNTTLSPSDKEFRLFVSLKEYTKQANHPVKDMLPVRSYLLPDFPDPATFQTPGPVQTIPPTIERVIQNYFVVEEIVLYSIHRDTPEANWPVADIIMFLKKR